MCGLCLPHCPTYQVSLHEGESPRGRISLIKAYAQGDLSASPAIQTHLQSCTACMQCEQVCPADVPYQSILDTGRCLYRSRLSFKTRSIQTLAINLLTKKWGHSVSRLLLAVAGIGTRLGLFGESEAMQLARVVQKQKTLKSSTQQTVTNNQVTLFLGCTAELLDRESLHSALMLINALDYQAQLPQKLLCCGALAQHSGLPDIAQRQRRQAHADLQSEEIISFASGCGQQLEQDGISNVGRHYDIHQWLLRDNKLSTLNLRPLAKTILLHTPCSMRSDQVEAMVKVLEQIPAVTLQRFDDNLFCCGAGGMQILTPEASNQALLQSKIDKIKALQPDIIVTANIGCALQFQKGLHKADLDIAVVHTATLLARQLQD